MPSRVLQFQKPRQVLVQAFPHITAFSSELPHKVFGCSSFVHIHQQDRTKLDPKSIKCIFLGYSSHKKRYKCYSLVTRKVYNSMDIIFFEHQSYYPKPTIQGENSREYQLWDILQDTRSKYFLPQTVAQTPSPSFELANLNPNPTSCLNDTQTKSDF